MNKLLTSNFSRLIKSKLFWLCCIIMFGFATLLVLAQYNDNVKYGSEPCIDKIIFAFTLFLGILSATFSSLFIGVEYSDGTIRNKVIVGHSRTAIYISNLIVTFTATLLMCFSFLIAMMAMGIPLLGAPEIGWLGILLTLLSTIVLLTTYCSIVTLLSMLCSNKTIVAVVSILGMLALLLVASMIRAKLDAPEYYDGVVFVNDSGEMSPSAEKNPEYLTGTTRIVYQTIYDILPTGQSIQYSDLSYINFGLLPVYSALITVVTTMIGIAFFRKKDIK